VRAHIYVYFSTKLYDLSVMCTNNNKTTRVHVLLVQQVFVRYLVCQLSAVFSLKSGIVIWSSVYRMLDFGYLLAKKRLQIEDTENYNHNSIPIGRTESDGLKL